MGTKHQTRLFTILLADDHAHLRAAIKRLLDGQPDLKVVGEAQNGVRALTLARELQPDLILLDLTMPGISGLDVLRTIRGIAPRSKVLSLHDDEQVLQETLTLGAAGYVLKKAVDNDLPDVIRALLGGDSG